MSVLFNGDTFPALDLAAAGGRTISLPGDLGGAFGVVLIYRGAWCPYCNAQLAAFSRAAATFDELGVKVVAFSVDDERTTQELVDTHHLAFPVGHSADPDEVSRKTGAYVNPDPRYLQSTGFVLAPDGTIVNAVYSSGAIGRLVADDVAGLVRYIRAHV